MTAILAVSIMASCEEKEQPITPEPSTPTDSVTVTPQAPTLEEQGYIVLTSAEGTTYPNYNYIGLCFASETDSLFVDFNTNGEEMLPTGEYTVDDVDNPTYAAGTWDPAYSYYLAPNEGAMLADGTISVKKSGRTYTIKADCVTETGDSVKYAYVGQINLEVFSQISPEPSYSLSWENIDPEYSYYVNLGDRYAYILAVVEPSTGWEFNLAFTGDTTDTHGALPTGTFSMLAASEIVDNAIVPGYADATGIGGSYFIIWDNADATFNPFVDGQIVIETVDGNTTLTGRFITYYADEVGVEITGASPVLEEYIPQGVAPKAAAKARKKAMRRPVTIKR